MSTTELEKLADELDGQHYEARLVTPQGRRPFVHVRNRRAGMLKENIYAGDGWFWWGWAERIASVTDVAAAAEAVARVLRAVDAGRSAGRGNCIMSEPVRELATLQQAIPPNWRAWAGVNGRLYVRRLRTSPPRTLTGTAVGELASQASTVEQLYRLLRREGN